VTTSAVKSFIIRINPHVWNDMVMCIMQVLSTIKLNHHMNYAFFSIPLHLKYTVSEDIFD